MNAPARIPEPAARVDSTAVRPRLSASAATVGIAGAAIGWRNTRVATPFVDSCTPAEAVARRSSSVLILAPLQRITMYQRCDSARVRRPNVWICLRSTLVLLAQQLVELDAEDED